MSKPNVEKEILAHEKARLAAILEASMDCIISIDRLGNIMEFNPAAERTFGYRRDDVMGKEMASVIIPPSLRDAHRQGLLNYLKTGEGRVLGKRIELPAMKSDGTEFPVEISILRLRLEGAPLFTGFIRDITEQKRADEEWRQLLRRQQTTAQRLSAQFESMRELSSSRSIEEAASNLLKAIGNALGWDVGIFWMVEEGARSIGAIETWCSPSARPFEFLKDARNRHLIAGQGLPGRIWSTGAPMWIEDVTLDLNFPRREIAAREGLRGAFGFPIFNENRVLGVIECFSQRAVSADEELLTTVAAIGGQIGQFVERRRAEESLLMSHTELEEKVEKRTAELRKNFQALRESEERLRLMIDSVRDYAIFRIDLDGQIISWNKGAERLTGYDESEVIGKAFTILFTQEDINRGKPQEELKAGYEKGRFEDLVWRVRKDGSRFWANVVLAPIIDAEGNNRGFVKVVRDLSEQKRIQELEETIRVRDEFLSIASHELKTPITSTYLQQQVLHRMVMNAKNAQVFDLKKNSLLLERLEKGLEKAEDSSKSVVKMLDTLLDMTRIRLGKLTVEKVETDLVKITQSVLSCFETEIKRAGVTVKLNSRVSSVIGYWDPTRLGQVITNLVSNAIKYGEGRPVEVVLEADQEMGAAILKVKDHGMGISEEMLPKLFQRFERGVAVERISGLGLGLYIVHQIVQAHGGTIFVESKVGKGSIFTLRLPLAMRLQEERSHAS